MRLNHLTSRIVLLLFSLFLLGPHSARAGEVVLQDSKVLVTFSSETGALTRLVDKTTGWTIARRPDLGMSFRMLVPLPDRQDNFILGQKQRAASVERVSKNEIVMQWKDLSSQHGGVLPIIFKATVSLNDGVLEFGGEVINNSRLTVQTLDYPYFGDFNMPSRESRVSVRTMWYGSLDNDEIYPDFVTEKGYWGTFYPTKTFDSYKSAFCLIQARSQGLYLEVKSPEPRYLIQYTFEQHPGVLSRINNIVPAENEIGGKAVHLEFRMCHFIFDHPGSTFKLTPVVMQCYEGDWHAGVDIYKKWRKTWFRQPHLPKWVEQVNSWQQIQLNSPVQDYRIPYDSLVDYGRECAANGVKAIQVTGWNKGGQDGDDPSMAIEPHLGTWQEFHDAIQRVQAMGVKVILFGKLDWADLTTEWYKKDLYKYECKDPYGVAYEQNGYSYFTPVQLAALNNHRRAVMDFLDPAYRKIAMGQFEKLLSLGASGWLFDEVCGHGMVVYNFATGHGYTPPGYLYAGDVPMAKELRAAADSVVGRNFLFAGEGPQDWLMQYYAMSYFRLSPSSTPVSRYIDPHAPLMVAVYGYDDHYMLNQCLLDRYIIEYEPLNFKGHLSDFPQTLEYGKKIDALRRKYRTYLWDADFRDTMGASVRADGNYKYSVFVTSAGKRAVVVVNEGFKRTLKATVVIPNHGRLFAATPERPDAVASNGTLHIPPRSVAVLVEK